MDRRLFLWGLSNGAMVLALAGGFWIGLGVGMMGQQGRWAISAAGTVIQIGGTAGLFGAAFRLRRRSGFHRSELRQLDGVAEAQRHRIIKWMAWTSVVQTLLCGILVWACVRAQAEHLIWASIGVVVSLHFAPLGRLFHMPPYYAIAVAGTIVCVAGLALSSTPVGVASLGVGMAAVMWIVDAYVLLRADRIADRACAESWA